MKKCRKIAVGCFHVCSRLRPRPCPRTDLETLKGYFSAFLHERVAFSAFSGALGLGQRQEQTWKLATVIFLRFFMKGLRFLRFLRFLPYVIFMESQGLVAMVAAVAAVVVAAVAAEAPVSCGYGSLCCGSWGSWLM